MPLSAREDGYLPRPVRKHIKSYNIKFKIQFKWKRQNKKLSWSARILSEDGCLVLEAGMDRFGVIGIIATRSCYLELTNCRHLYWPLWPYLYLGGTMEQWKNGLQKLLGTSYFTRTSLSLCGNLVFGQPAMTGNFWRLYQTWYLSYLLRKQFF